MKISKKILEIDRLVSQLSRQRNELDTSDEMMLEAIQDTIAGILYTIHLNKVKKDRESTIKFKNIELINKYRSALQKASTTEELKCHVLGIMAIIEKLKMDDYEPTALDTVWVDYFLE